MKRQKVIARAAELGAEVDDARWVRRIIIDAPKGYVFSGSLTHAVVAWWGREEGLTKGEAWQSLFDDMSRGIERCPENIADECSSYGCVNAKVIKVGGHNGLN